MTTRGYLGPAFVVLHTPARVTGCSVVIAPPLGYEDTAAYRPLRHLAVALAQAGHPVLRIDWPGLGDSAGDARDALVPVWLSVLDQARAACGDAVVIGVRAGGLLAAQVAFSGRVLWGCPVSGKAFLREQRAFHAVAAEMIGDRRSGVPEGAVEAGGFWYSEATVQALTPLTLPASTVPELRLSRDGLKTLLEDPYGSGLPEGAVAEISAFLAGIGGAGRVPVLEQALQGEGWRETPWVIAGGAGELSGILTQPSRPQAAGVMVFFNAGGIRRSGPNRLWTRLARAHAAEGGTALRVDVRDVGDSDGATVPHTDLNAMYSESSIADAVLATDWARERGRAHLVGLCSGGFLALQAASRRPVWRVTMLNTLVYTWDEDAKSGGLTGQIRASLFSRRRWGRLLSGKIDGMELLRALVTRVRLGIAGWGKPQASEAATVFRRARVLGAELRIVASAGDPSLQYLARHIPEAERPDPVVIVGVDHTIRPVWAHALVERAVLG